MYNLQSTLKVRNTQLNTFRIRLSKTSMPTLTNLVLDKTPREFHYKLGINTNLPGPSLNFTIC